MIKIYIYILFLLFSIPVFSQNIMIDEQLAAGYFLNGQFEEAAELYEQLYNKTLNPAYYQSLLRTYFELKSYKKAEKLIEKRIKQNPSDLTLRVDLGSVYLANQNHLKAKKEFKSAIASIPADLNTIHSLAQAFLKIHESEYAVETYETARKSFQNKDIFIFQLLDLYEKMGLHEKMATECLDLIEVLPQRTEEVQIFLQNYFAENNKKVIASFKKNLLNRLQKQPNNKQFNGMLLWLALQEKDFEFAVIQAVSIDKRFPEENGTPVFQIGEISLLNADYNSAASAFEYLIKKGAENPFYTQSQIKFLESKYLKITRQLIITKQEIADLRIEYEKALAVLGKKTETISLIKNLAHLEGFYANDIQSAADLLSEAIEIPQGNRQLTAECKLELADILLFGGDIWEASLRYMQVEKDFKNDILGSLAKFKNAKLSYYIGDFLWAKTQLEVLRASTSKLIANDAMELSLLISDNMDDDSTYSALSYYAKADLLSFRNQNDEALLILDTIALEHISHPIFDEVLFKKAKIKIKQEKYHEADSLLQRLINFYADDILADDALFILAELNEKQFNDQEKAQRYYEEIILNHPASIYVTEARKRYYFNKIKPENKELKWKQINFMESVF